jgi:hypothetical protein
MLLVFVVIALTVLSVAVVLMITSGQAALGQDQAARANYMAEGAAENAMIRLLRDPDYVGETLTFTDGQATIAVSGSNPKTVSVVATSGQAIAKVSVVVATNLGVTTVTEWNKVY